MTKHILGINGSLRKASLNQALLEATLDAMGPAVTSTIADIGALPLYNSELDGDDKPDSVQLLTEQVHKADALLIVTPEYNYSITGALKNAIDWVSRPAYRSPLAHKPAGIMGASMSPVGTARAQGHLKQILAGTVTPVFPYPEFLMGAAHTKFEGTKIVDQSTVEHIEKYAAAFLEWIGRG